MADALRVPLYPCEKSQAPSTCCVTGATGYIAGAIVQRLLAAGHTVHATCRNPADTAKVAHLQALPGATKRLCLFKADLNDPASFDEAVKDCRFVFHVASPFIMNVKPSEVQQRLVGPAVSGVEAVLGAVSRAGTAEAVVMTSSVAAVFGDVDEHGKGHVMTEADWNNSASATSKPYSYSKTLAERKAWELYEAQKNEQNPWRLAVINPAFVMGPPLALLPAESVQFCTNMIDGKFKAGLPNLGLGWVDVDDVASAHVVAALTPTASGRYLCAATTCGMNDMVRKVEQMTEPPRRLAGGSPPRWVLWILCNVFGVFPWDQVAAALNKDLKIDNSKIKKDLGIQFRDPAESLVEMMKAIETLRQSK